MKSLNTIIRWSLQNRWLVLILAFILTGYGIRAASQISIDVLPDFSPRQVNVLSEYPGATPKDVETLVTRPLEDLLRGTAKAKLVRSISTSGLSVITVIFPDQVDLFQARQFVMERLQQSDAKIPIQVKPQLAPAATVTGDILKVAMVSHGNTSLMDLRTIAERIVLRRIMAVADVANVVIYGGEERQYQVLVDPTKLAAYNISLNEVVEAAQASNANASGGILRQTEREWLIHGQGMIRSNDVGALSQRVVAMRHGIPVTLAQVATVKIGTSLPIGDAIVNGEPGVIVNVVKQPWANTLTTTRAVEKTLLDLSPSMPEDVNFVTVFRQSDFIEVAVSNVLEALVLGGICVAAVLFIFLRSGRAALISMTAIPLSLLVVVILLNCLGLTINTMALAGLAIAIGEVVDDAIIDVENIIRRLKENAMAGHPRSTVRVIYDASVEIRSSVVYATFIVSLVFLPVLSLVGLEGKIFTPLAVSYVIAILASLLVALTVTPVLCYLLLSGKGASSEKETGLVLWLKEKYTRILSFSLGRPKATILIAALLFLMSLPLLFFQGKEFLPPFDESNLIVAVNSPVGTSLTETKEIGKSITQYFAKDKRVLAIGQRAGRAPRSDDYEGSYFAEFDLRLKAGVNVASFVQEVRQHFAYIPGLTVNVGSYIGHRMDHVLSGIPAQLAIKVFGPDLDTLHKVAGEIHTAINNVPGLVDVQIEPLVPLPQIAIEIDRQQAARYGLKVAELAATIETAFNGKVVSKVIEDQDTVDLVVWSKPAFRSDIEALKATLIDTPSGLKIPLSSVAVVSFSQTANTIRHEMFSRLVVLQANVAGRDLGSVINDVRSSVKDHVNMPSGYYVQYGGQFEAQEAATRQLILLSAISCLAIFALLCMAFGSAFAAILVMLNLPLAFVGGIWAVLFTGSVLSVGSMIGFITLLGISTRNGIMLVSHYNHLKAQGYSLLESITEGSLDRLSPVLMTALTAALGLLPIALLGGAGRELEQPLAVVILGGMFSSTTLTLFVIPAVFKLFGDKVLPENSLSKQAEDLLDR